MIAATRFKDLYTSLMENSLAFSIKTVQQLKINATHRQNTSPTLPLQREGARSAGGVIFHSAYVSLEMQQISSINTNVGFVCPDCYYG